MQSVEKPSLYDRLGGVYSIATVVDDFIDRIMHDPRLNANTLTRPTTVCRRPDSNILRQRWSVGLRAVAKVHGQVDGGFAFTLEDYWQGMGCVHGRLSADVGQGRGPHRGASRTESDC